ncbi:MAG: aldo/keto reductase [Myxococcales bacterium]|nr:aldo/keto reductase [Myxococcales bacterium]
MQTIKLGRTGYEVSRLGLGTWGLGGDSWRGQDSRDSQRAVYHAVERGVTFIDTALEYGDGNSERLVGEVVRDLRAQDSVVVATKVPPADDHWPGRATSPLASVFAPAYVTKQVEQSLRNLRLETLPIAQLHVWHDAWLDDPIWPELRDAMQRLTRAGHVQHWGLSVNDHAPATALRAAASGDFSTVQVIFNIFDQAPREALLAACQPADVGVIFRCPLDEGALAGRVGVGSTFPPHDWRNRYFAAERLPELARRIAALCAYCRDVAPAALSEETAKGIAMTRMPRDYYEAADLPELALRFVNSFAGCVIPGMRQKKHVDHSLAAVARGPLSSALIDELAAHAWQKNWY